MYRMPEKQHEVKQFQITLKVVFISMYLKLPAVSIKLKYPGFLHLFDLLCFILYYVQSDKPSISNSAKHYFVSTESRTSHIYADRS